MKTLTKKQIEKIELEYSCHSVSIEDNYITGIYDSPSNPENIGERINIIDYYEWINEQDDDETEEPETIQYCGGYNLEDEANYFNWYNTDFPMTSVYFAAELAAANDLMSEVDTDHKYYQEIIWNMLCEVA